MAEFHLEIPMKTIEKAYCKIWKKLRKNMMITHIEVS